MQPPLARTEAELARLLDTFLGRFAYVGARNLEAFAERFAACLKATEVPRDPFHLLPALGITVERTALAPRRRAMWTREGTAYRVYVSQHDPPGEAHLSLWHEMFEMLAERPRFPTALSPAALERLADRFAALMLMPAGPLAEQAAGLATNPSGLVRVLADRFGVTPAAMRSRLYELGILRPRSRVVHPPLPPARCLGTSTRVTGGGRGAAPP